LPKRDGRDLARVIATNAQRDAVAVEKLAPDPELADDIVGLHAQQATEKYLKAVLAHRGIN
jgi:HEPN domain